MVSEVGDIRLADYEERGEISHLAAICSSFGFDRLPKNRLFMVESFTSFNKGGRDIHVDLIHNICSDVKFI